MSYKEIYYIIYKHWPWYTYKIPLPLVHNSHYHHAYPVIYNFTLNSHKYQVANVSLLLFNSTKFMIFYSWKKSYSKKKPIPCNSEDHSQNCRARCIVYESSCLLCNPVVDPPNKTTGTKSIPENMDTWPILPKGT